jgi:hypothetical protein
LSCAGCKSCNTDCFYYYETLQDALLDINSKCVGVNTQDNSDHCSVMVDLHNEVPVIYLLKNITMSSEIQLNNVNLNLNGFMLENNEFSLIKIDGVCNIYNGSIYNYRLCISRKSICYVDNIVLENESTTQTNIAINVYGEISLTNSTIEVFSLSSNRNFLTAAVYGNIFSKIHIENSNIIAKSDFGRVDGVYVGDMGWLKDSYIVACANYLSNELTYTSCAIGCNNNGVLVVDNCNIYGVHSGINSYGTLSIDGGTYCGYGHGGIYCAGTKQTYMITNATILQVEMPMGYEDMGVGCTQGGLYIGGGINQDNIKVFIDKCTIKATKNPIVLRGTSGEKNNSLYISNTDIDVKHIRVDNDTHRIYLGDGCNFEVSHIDIPDIVVYSDVDYDEH